MNDLLRLLAAFFRPQIGDPEPDPTDPDPKPDDDDPQPELDLDEPKSDAEPKDDPKAELENARREAREAREAAERYQRELSEERIRRAPPPPSDEVAREEARLKDPQTPELEKWQIQANRTLRQNTSAAQFALAQAHDVSDRTAFASIAMTDPTAKRYEARVEQELAKMREKGQNAAREAIYTYLLGKDMREGKFKKKAAPAAKGETVDRGKLPGARSDVRAKGNASEREKRIERLRNTQI